MFPLQAETDTQQTPWVTWLIILICSAVYLWQLSLGKNNLQFIFTFGMIPALLFGQLDIPSEVSIIPAWMRMFSYLFLHGNWMHIIGNMIYLYIFGGKVEEAMGRTRFILFFLLCGIVAALAKALSDIDSQVPMVGASGAIAGVLGAYLLLYPRVKIIVWVPLIFIMLTLRIAAVFVLSFYFVIQLYQFLGVNNSESPIAFVAHIGGFLAGILLIPFFKKKHIKLFAKDSTNQ